jgi:glutamate-ammonia-ligase adenylyltransferase
MLATLFGTSDRLAELLIRRPASWDSFLTGIGDRVRSRDELARRLEHSLAGDSVEAGDRLDEEDALRQLRRFQADEVLRIGMHDVAGSLSAAEVTGQLTDLAEVCLGAAIAAVMPGLTARWGTPRTSFTVLGLGSLGAREMRYGSDLDLVFLYGADGESTTGVEHREWFARAAPRFISAMEAMMEEGRLYKVDTRLRPSGEQGLLVTSWPAFERYHQGEAAGWERVALLRARVVHTDDEAPEARAAALATIAFDHPIDDRRFRGDLRGVRTRVEKERGRVPAGSRHLRFDPGGIMDVEFLVALGQLRHPADPAVRTTVTADALSGLVARGWPVSLLDDNETLRRVALRLRLLLDRPEDVISPRDVPVLARSLGTTPEVFSAALDIAMLRVREIFEREFPAG